MSALTAATSGGTGAELFAGADDDGFFGIRFESIGGLGAHLAGKMLVEAGVLRQGLNGAHFSSYGSEKKGTPVKSFVRCCAGDREVRTSSPIERPQEDACVLDPERPCHACLAASPSECPYPYLLDDTRRGFPIPVPDVAATGAEYDER